ncbi:MAG: XrtA system polysaccharide chain length determinant [Oxalobacteraceae bacterium]
MEDLVTKLLSHLKGIWKYRWFAVVVTWVVAIVGWIAVTALPDNYQASARVYVDTQNILKPLLSGMTNTPNVEQQVSIMSRTLLSRPNMARVLRMVDLDIKAKTIKDHEQLVDNLMSQLKIGGTGRDDIYTIFYDNANPKLAKDIVQSLLTIFVEGGIGNKKKDSDKAVQFIDEQIKNYEDKLISAENLLKAFKLKNMGLLPRQGGDYGSKAAETSESLNQAKLDLVEAEQARNSIQKQISGEEPVLNIEPSPADIINPEIDSRISALNKNLDNLRLQYTERHPDIISTKNLIAQLDARKLEESKLRKRSSDPGANYSPMLQQLKIALSEAEATVAAMKARVDEYSSRNAHMNALRNAAPEVESELSQLNRDYQVYKDNYEKLVGRREVAKLSGELSATTEMITFRVIDPPTVPLIPAGPNRPRLFSMVFLGALLAGVAGAFLMSQIRPTFLSINDLREVTGLPILGSVAMNWTDHEKTKKKKVLYAFGLSLISLLTLYGGIMAVMLLKV